jgi:hypothetical protein
MSAAKAETSRSSFAGVFPRGHEDNRDRRRGEVAYKFGCRGAAWVFKPEYPDLGPVAGSECWLALYGEAGRILSEALEVARDEVVEPGAIGVGGVHI